MDTSNDCFHGLESEEAISLQMRPPGALLYEAG